jgi:hypothetical protein
MISNFKSLNYKIIDLDKSYNFHIKSERGRKHVKGHIYMSQSFLFLPFHEKVDHGGFSSSSSSRGKQLGKLALLQRRDKSLTLTRHQGTTLD